MFQKEQIKLIQDFMLLKISKNATELFEIAKQKLTKLNKDKVNNARAKILMFAHNKGAVKELGITQIELNKLLRSWSSYSAMAREVSETINAGIATSNKWTGIENSSYINRANVTVDDVEMLVNNVIGDSSGYERKYIARVMLALDTHINYKPLKFLFQHGVKSGNKLVLGYYNNSDLQIVVNPMSPHTIAHEMGHYIDYQWARELGLAGTMTSKFGEDRITDKQTKQFIKNFDLFIDSLTDHSDISSAYKMDSKEVFARFVAKFVQWTDNTATGNKSYNQETSYYDDKFGSNQYIEFAKLLQEKAAIDSAKIENDVKYSLKDSILESDIKYSIKELDKKTLDFLNNQETVKVYRAMQVIDGKLYPPMAAKLKGEDGKKNLVSNSELGKWEQAEERPDLIKNGNKFNLDKANGSSIEASYNPYFHTSLSPLNDQFSSAYKRDNLVVIEGEVPSSELTSGYKAEFAKDAVGEMKWHSGVVSSKLPKGKERKVILSRWFKPTRILSDAEVANKISTLLEGENIDIPHKVVTSSLRKELENVGVKIKYSLKDSKGNKLSEQQQEYFKDSKVRDKDGNLLVTYHGTNAKFNEFSLNYAPGWGTGIYLTDNLNNAKEYGKNVVEVYVNIKKPFHDSDKKVDISKTKAYKLYEDKIIKRTCKR